MSIINIRRQHSVGQGFFHSGEIHSKDKPRLSYVYDCGAMHSYAAARKREIRDYLKGHGPKAHLDILYLSHVHADHVNGVPQLLHKKRGVRVDTIVLPLINVVERLIAFTRTSVEDPASAADGFYRDFIIDPASTLGRFKPRQIIFIRSSRPAGSTPDGGEPPPEKPDEPVVCGRKTDERGPAWKLHGRYVVETAGLSKPDDLSSARHLVIDDSAAFSVGHHINWLLAPYVDPGIAAQQRKFLSELAKACKIAPNKLKAWLTVSANVETLVTTKVACLKTAYAAVSGDLNITSLCLYSGPAEFNPSVTSKAIQGRFGRVHNASEGPDNRIAWLGTGDATLKQIASRKAFAKHYGKLLNEVATLTLPHHGSDENFDPDLLSRVGATVYIAAADKFSTWKHPGPHTIQSICSVPAVLQVVTSKQASHVFEGAYLG